MQSDDTYHLWSNHSLIRFLVTRVSSSLAFQMITVAVGWQIYALTKSAFYLGLIGLVEFIPMILLTLVVGYAADHLNRKLIICVCEITLSACFMTLAVQSLLGVVTKESILAVAFFAGAANSFQGPSVQSLLPNIVSREVFPKAAATNASTFQIATIIGPALGGLLYAFGPEVVYCTAAAFSLAAGLNILWVRVAPREISRNPISLQNLLAGIAFIRHRPIVLGAISLDLFAVLFGGATALLPIYAGTILNVGAAGLGVLRAAPAAGALIVSFLLSRRPVVNRVGMKMFTAVICFGLATVGFALSHWFALSLLMLFVLGASDVISVVIRSTLVQIETPDDMRGRVSSVNQVFVGTSNQLGEFESGLTASWFGPMPAAVIGGVGTIAVVLLWLRVFPQLRGVDRFEQLGRPAPAVPAPGEE